jgi:opacity protein-like surface antigen
LAQQFTPYVGAGAGYEWLWVQGTDQDGVPFSNDYSGFGAQLMGGLNIMASPTVGLYGEAVYNISTLDFDYFDPTLNAQIKESVNMDGVAVHGGLRFRF